MRHCPTNHENQGYKTMTVKHREAGLSEVIGFVLLLGVVVAAMALWMMYVIPVNGREEEITHMNEVKDRFTDYKISLDSLWINRNKDSNYNEVPLSGVTLSTSFNLGTGGGNTGAGGMFLSLMKPVASSAVLSYKDSGDLLNIARSDGSNELERNYSIQKIEYQSQNNYWIQQRYYYQMGGVFLAQDSGSVTRVAPPISIVNYNDLVNYVTIVPITLDGGGSIGGNGPVRVDSRLKTIQPAIGPENTCWVNISVLVPDYATAQMWNAIFIDALNNGGVTNKSWYTTGISPPGIAPATAYVFIKGPIMDCSDTTKDVQLTIHPVEYAVTFNNIATGIT